MSPLQWGGYLMTVKSGRSEGDSTDSGSFCDFGAPLWEGEFFSLHGSPEGEGVNKPETPENTDIRIMVSYAVPAGNPGKMMPVRATGRWAGQASAGCFGEK